MKRGKDLICVVCEDESGGLHFGQATCRACAAFFRRTVSQKLQYTCKSNGECEIDKDARNMCRSCRFRKCLATGMLTSAVQNIIPDDTNSELTMSSACVGSAHVSHLLNQSPLSAFEVHQTSTTNSNPNPTHGLPTFFMTSAAQQQVKLEPQLGIGSSISSANGQQEIKHLNRMLDGYHQFLSLRKAGYAMVQDLNLTLLAGDEVPRSHYDNYEKISKISSSFKYNMVNRFYWPFYQLPAEDKKILFHSFLSLCCNAERAYCTAKRYGPEDDRLIMPDGGYVRLTELYLFFKDSKKVTGDPEQVARIFHNAIQYLITNVVGHIRNINMQEMELMAICGIFLWSDSPDVSTQTLQTTLQVRNEIIVDLHRYYRSLGITEDNIMLKTGNLFLLIPKLETVVKMMLEDASISDIFDMLHIEEPCKSI